MRAVSVASSREHHKGDIVVKDLYVERGSGVDCPALNQKCEGLERVEGGIITSTAHSIAGIDSTYTFASVDRWSFAQSHRNRTFQNSSTRRMIAGAVLV